MHVKFWGVRGSIPAPLSTDQLQEKLFRALSASENLNTQDPAEVRAFIASLPLAVQSVVGGNTTCVEISSGNDTIIIDAGSGIRALGHALMATEFGRGQGTAHVFLTHAHWDHLQGLPFFGPAFMPGNKIIFYAVNHDPRSYLEHQQVAPVYFPIQLSQMPATFEYVTLKEGDMIQIGRCTISSMALYHPGTAYAYRFDDGESVFVFASDGEYKSLDDDGLQDYVKFFYGADALVFDCQYSLRDVLLSKADWGHSSAMIGVEIAERAQAKKLITTHYDPADTDEQIYNVANSARRYAEITPAPGVVEIIVGTEGLELFLGPPMGLEILEDYEAEVWLAALAGKLGNESAAEAEETLSAFLRRAPGQRAILDLTLLAAIDSIGVLAILNACRAVEGAQLAFVAPAAFVRRCLENSSAREVGPIFRSRSQALAAMLSPAHMDLQTLGAYQLGKVISADALGAIYSAVREGSREPLVIQVLGSDVSPAQRLAFADSTGTWCDLTHPRLIPGVDVIVETDRVAFVGEHPAGESWDAWMETQGWQLSFEAGLRWMAEMADALHHAHRRGVVHGELSPECFVFTNDHARISRVPLVPAIDTQPLAYTSPEQLKGEAPTAQSDQFALGAMLYEVLTGSHPFAAESEEQAITQQLFGAPLSPRVSRPDIPDDLHAFIERLLARNPTDRFAETDEAAEVAESILAALKTV
jgi:phosphoribosyl 1,2-cyclic phosphodiesterase/anti-anti-sigma regulatory factor